MKKEMKTLSRYIKSEGECANSHAIIQKQTNNNKLNYVNNKMLEHDWLLTTLIYALIGCFRSKLSDLTCAITNICNRTGQIGQLNSQSWQPCKRNLYVVPVNTTQYGLRSLKFTGPRLWNSLPISIINSNSLKIFRKTLKNSTLNCYSNYLP